MFLTEKTPLVAIDIGTHSVKMAQMAGSRNKFELLNFSMMPLKEDCIVDGVIKQPDEVVDTLTKMIKAENINTKYAVASIAGEAVIVKKIRVPRMSAEELAENIENEAEQYIPFDIDDVSIDFQLLNAGTLSAMEDQDQETMEILLVAVQKDYIESLTDVLYDAGLKPAIIDLDVFAMANACELGVNLHNKGVIAVIDLGESFTHLHIMQDGLTSYTRDIPLGGGHCTKKLMSKFDLAQKETVKLKLGKIPDGIENDDVVQVIVQSLEKIIDEVQKSFQFFNTTSNSEVDRVYLTGGGALLSGADSLFAHHLSVPVEILNPMNGIKVNKRKFDQATVDALGPLSTVALGLAARRFDYQ
ncbi:MAG: pilus assembly protein PilM [Nitrospinaceae bacterium]|nr:MAG: pilus assembly protein PilM [Nitrospinaceae bacterium]